MKNLFSNIEKGMKGNCADDDWEYWRFNFNL